MVGISTVVLSDDETGTEFFLDNHGESWTLGILGNQIGSVVKNRAKGTWSVIISGKTVPGKNEKSPIDAALRGARYYLWHSRNGSL